MAQERYREGTGQRSAKPGTVKQNPGKMSPLPRSTDPMSRGVADKSAARRAAEKHLQAKRQKEALASQRKAERRERRRVLFRVSLSIALVFVLLYWGWVALSIGNRQDKASEDALPLLIFRDGQRKEDTRLEAQEVFFHGSSYLPVTFLEPYMAISQFGDYQTRSFLLCDTGEWATFYLGSCNAIVNGEKVSLRSAVFLRDEVLYLPVDFFSDKMNCFTFTHSSALSANVLTYNESVSPGFYFHASSPTAPVDPATAPAPPADPGENEAPTTP